MTPIDPAELHLNRAAQRRLARGALVTLGVLTALLNFARADENTELLGRFTNGPAVYDLHRTLTTRLTTNPPVAAAAAAQVVTNTTHVTNATFLFFVPDSLNHRIWTNFIAHTNGRSTLIWSTRTHPPNWPTNPPSATWNPHSLIWGWRGLTALSPSWEGQGWPGQVPVTALTRRHGYTRGHGMGEDGFSTNRLGRKVWFATTNNTLVEVRITHSVVRTHAGGRGDYTILLFDRDLPAGIEPVRVASLTNVLARYATRPSAPWPIFKTEQQGHVSADVPGFTVNTWKGGDSGSPNLLPLDGELVFIGGRSTSGASPEMQADIEELCRRAGLDPRRYPLQWVDLDAFPTY